MTSAEDNKEWTDLLESLASNDLLNDNLTYKELNCLQQQQLELNSDLNISGNYCPTSFDTILCWPQTSPNTLAILPCFDEFKGVHYDSTQNATRYCHGNGTWDTYTNYNKCHNAIEYPAVPDFALNIELPAYIYCCGYLLSLIFLLFALIILLLFKDLKCLRNTIHANLFLTYILSALLWILTLFLQVITDNASQAGCITLVMLFHYFNLTNFFWMFVEGLYLYMLVVETFSVDNLTFLHYALIGWGCPVLIVAAWCIAKILVKPLEREHYNSYPIDLDIECTWIHESLIDWIFQAPTSLVLILNLIFLIRIMWVLIIKLRSTNTLETRQYYKASKALLVLIPLFGTTYLLMLVGPDQGISRQLFEMIRAFLISSQGFLVSLLFCFLNSEVRQTLYHRFTRWQENRNFNYTGSNRKRRRFSSKEHLQQSGTESLRCVYTTCYNADNIIIDS